MIAIVAIPLVIFIVGPFTPLNTAEVLALYACLQLGFLGWDFAAFRGKMINLMFALHMKIDALGVMVTHSMGPEDHQQVVNQFDEMIQDLKARTDIADQADRLAKQQRRNRRRRGRNSDDTH